MENRVKTARDNDTKLNPKVLMRGAQESLSVHFTYHKTG